MTREEYLTLRKRNDNYGIVYQYYISKFDREKHKPFLSHNELFVYINMWTMQSGIVLGQIADAIVDKLDDEFAIIHVIDREGNYMTSV